MDRMPCSILIPAAGDSVRFKEKTPLPKGLIRFKWRGVRKTMIEHCVPSAIYGSVFVGCKKRELPQFRTRLPGFYHFVPMDPTSGQAETVLRMALHMQNFQTDLLIINSDNAFNYPTLENFVHTCRIEEVTLGALTFCPKSNKNRYGYVDSHPHFTHGREKLPISLHALAGAFYVSSTDTLIDAARTAHDEAAGYLSEMFIFITGKKLSVEITEFSLHEWGTPETLEADETVTIDWSNL